MSGQTTPSGSSSAIGRMLVLLGLTGVGTAGLALLAPRLGNWAGAASIGWLASGLMGCLSWWTARRALRADPGRFFKVLMGGMILRLVLVGAGVAVVFGADLLDPAGFVGGLLAGVVIFQTLEITSLAGSARKTETLAARGAPGAQGA